MSIKNLSYSSTHLMSCIPGMGSTVSCIPASWSVSALAFSNVSFFWGALQYTCTNMLLGVSPDGACQNSSCIFNCRCPKCLYSLCWHLSGDFTVDVISVVMLLLVVDIAIVLFVASEIWFIVDISIALVGMKLCQ